MASYRILAGDCVARMGMMNQNSIDNIITDPPYEIGFMGNGWDNTGIAYNPATWRAAHRVLKSNGLMLVFGAARTHHRIAHAIQRAGFEIVDIIAWCYGTGFPKSHNIEKSLAKKGFLSEGWKGWGTALKPAWEPIIVARKKGSQRKTDYSQFHYIAKPSKNERNAGLEDKSFQNKHPTVKPVKLMKALIKEFTEEGSTVFDPFTGSGTTGIACVKTGRKFIGCELTPEYIPLAKARIEHHLPKEE